MISRALFSKVVKSRDCNVYSRIWKIVAKITPAFQKHGDFLENKGTFVDSNK